MITNLQARRQLFMNLDEMRKLKKEIEEKRKLNEMGRKEEGKEFRNLINASREKQTALKRQISKGIKRKESFFPGIELGHLAFLVIVLISIISVLVFIPFEIKKVFQRRYIPVETGESNRIAEFTGQIFELYKKDGSGSLKSKWSPIISRRIAEKSLGRMESIAGEDAFKIRGIHLDRKTSCYSVCYEGASKKTLTFKIVKSRNGDFALMSIQ